MSDRSKKVRKNRMLKMESLENRELMAADVTANLSRGTLQISGSDRADQVVVNQVGQNITVSLGSSRPFASFSASQVNSLRVNLNGGNDILNVNLYQKSLDAVFVEMGSGSRERVDLKLGSARTLAVNAVNSFSTTAILSGNIQSRAEIDFGTDTGADNLFVNNSTFGMLDVKLGGGNDEFRMSNSKIDRAAIDFGAGDDWLNNVQSEVSSGSIDGGTAVRGNRWSGSRFSSRVAVRGF